MPIIGTMSALFDRQALTDEITFRLSVMETCIKWHSSRGMNDHAKTAEDVVARFLGALCGWSLINLNTIRPNYPAADLGDKARRLAVQVTVNGTAEKVRETHEKAIAHQLSADFDTLIILFLLPSAPADPRKSQTFTPCTSPKIEKWARPQLDARLLKQDDETGDAHLNRLRRSLAVLRDEMTGIHRLITPTRDIPPHYLPWASIGHYFKGRDTFLDELHATLLSRSTSAVSGHSIRGDGGIGKTCAVVEYAWRHFFLHTGLFFVTADTPDGLHSQIAALGRPGVLSLPGHAEKPQPQQEADVMAWLQQHTGWLLIIDNADTRESLDAVLQLLPALIGGHVIITTRHDRQLREITALRMDFLPEEESIAYLNDATRDYRQPSASDATDLPALVNALGGLPLALSQAAAHICHLSCSYGEYLQRWENQKARTLAWCDSLATHYDRSLAVTHNTSVAQLSEAAQALLHTLAWFAPDPIPRSLLENEAAPAGAQEHWADLKNLSLLRLSEDGSTFTVHRIVQEITRLQQQDSALDCGSPLPLSEGAAGPGPERGATADGTDNGHPLPSPPPADAAVPKRQRAAAVQNASAPPALLTALQWVNAEMPTDTDDVRTWPVAIPLLPHALTTAQAAAALDLPAPTARLLNQCALLEMVRANHRTAEPLYRTALALYEKHSGENHPDTATTLNNLAQLLKATNRLAEAEPLMRRALAIDEASFGKDHPTVAIRLNNLVTLFYATNRLEEAEPMMERVISIFESAYGQSHPTVAVAINNLVVLLEARGKGEGAEEMYRRALAIDEASFGDSHPKVANRLNNLALTLMDAGRQAEAEPLLERACRIVEQSLGGEHPSTVLYRENLAVLRAKIARGGGV